MNLTSLTVTELIVIWTVCFPVRRKRQEKCTGRWKPETERLRGQCLDSILALRDLFLTTPSLLNAYTHAMNLLGCEGSFAIDYEDGISDDDRARVTEFMRKIGEI